MPYIHIVTNASIPDNTEEMLKTQLGRAIEILPGKNENWLMLNFHRRCSICGLPAATLRRHWQR